MSSGTSVRCAGLVHVYRVAGTDVAALRGVDIDVGPGERIALLGPSGSGKSTLLTVIAGLRRPSAGTVEIDGRDIGRATNRQLHAYRADTAGLMLQGALSNLLPWATPVENIDYATRGKGRPQTVVDVLAVAGIGGERRPVAALDSASQQVVALAVAMASAPRLLLVDEPTSQLDDQDRDVLLDALVDVTAAFGTTVLVVTHDEDVASRMQRMVRMRDGRVGSEGLRHEQFAVIGADGSLQLPEGLSTAWPPGSRVEVTPVSATQLRIDMRDERNAEPR